MEKIIGKANIFTNNTYRNTFKGITYIYKGILGSTYNEYNWEVFQEDGNPTYKLKADDPYIVIGASNDEEETALKINGDSGKEIELTLYKGVDEIPLNTENATYIIEIEKQGDITYDYSKDAYGKPLINNKTFKIKLKTLTDK
jgi:hypothetical protein